MFYINPIFNDNRFAVLLKNGYENTETLYPIYLDLIREPYDRSKSFKESDNKSNDMKYFSQEIPGLYFWLGVNKPGEGLNSANFGERTDVPGNHSPYFIVDDSALDEGVRAMVYLVLDYPNS